MVRLMTQAKNRLHSVLHRSDIQTPSDGELFKPEMRAWWEALPLSELEHFRLLCDLDTLDFARAQIARLEACLSKYALQDPRTPLLVQLPGIGLLSAISLLAAIGHIERFAESRHLVGYAGLGARVHDSGKSFQTGHITKSGRRDIRRVMVEAANHAVISNAHWKAVFTRLQPHMGRSKALVAIARHLLIAVWHVMTKETADRFANPLQVACSLFALVHRARVSNLPEGMTALQYTRNQLDRLGIGQDLERIPWGTKRFKLPPSTLAA